MAKKYAVWVVLVLTVIACYWVESKQDHVDDELAVTAKPRKERLVKQDAPLDTNHLSLISSNGAAFSRAQIVDEPENIFTMFVSQDDLNQQSVDQEIELPPENPFRYAGKLVDDGEILVFLIEGQKNYSVKVGDVLEDSWEIKAIIPPLMTIKYIPLNIEMQMQIGAVS